ncbi:hypothetical protein FMM05_06835 [Flavobacterium zepuense]|uniref:DUF6896 domain-containing protein n=1 Tax=Flavobacterium zepuense TaxID=2593302 RepID=A0A552V637_9FLAO|nr:hypothetical protein [Flavobacterium zepuense]TRW25933.1 hypothetical protein FMM05_06835 [Flavobacterium zepuense]
MAEYTLVDIIKEYQAGADTAVTIFKEKFGTGDILHGRRQKNYPRVGKLIENGIYRYAFHGSGLEVHFKDKVIDFDFAFFPEPRHDGFDLWRLSIFISNQRNKYPEYLDNNKLEAEFKELINNGIIAKSLLDSTHLYFFKDTI